MLQRLIKNKALIAKFLVVGSIGFFTNYAVLELVLGTVTQNKTIAAILAMAVTINLTFILHDKWTYISKKSGYQMTLPKRYVSYLSTNSSGAVITIVCFAILSTSLPNIVALAIAALTAMTWNFIMNLLVWRHRKGDANYSNFP